MNVYDFDGTIYDGDSSIDYYWYCLKHHPTIIFKLPEFLWHILLYKRKIINKTQLKESYFSFLKYIPNVETEVVLFWDNHICKIKKWYKQQQQLDDVIISASPFFLIDEACQRLGIKYIIASDVDPRTGKFNSPNCHDEQKVVYFKQQFPDVKIDKFYSDSLNDIPMARLADKAYLVKGEAVRIWKRQ